MADNIKKPSLYGILLLFGLCCSFRFHHLYHFLCLALKVEEGDYYINAIV